MNLEKIIPGSVKNKIVASDLQEERDKCTFDQQELRVLMYGGPDVYEHKTFYENLIKTHEKDLGNHHHFHEMSVVE